MGVGGALLASPAVAKAWVVTQAVAIRTGTIQRAMQGSGLKLQKAAIAMRPRHCVA